jgi:translation initiation factor 2 beta subunit (eIF-2beta)/eIF-5
MKSLDDTEDDISALFESMMTISCGEVIEVQFENLSRKTQKELESLKWASSTIENDILDALEEATTEREFIKISTERLKDLKNEVEDWIRQLNGGDSDDV